MHGLDNCSSECMHVWMQVLVVDTTQPQGLEGVLSAVTSHVGPPHNYTGFEPATVDSQPADVSRPAAAAEAADMGAEHAAAPQGEHLSAAQVRVCQKLLWPPLPSSTRVMVSVPMRFWF